MLEEVSGTGMLWPLLIIFLHRCHFFNFCKKMQKMKIETVHCPMRKFLRTSSRQVWTEQCGNLEEMRYLGKAVLVYPGFCLKLMITQKLFNQSKQNKKHCHHSRLSLRARVTLTRPASFELSFRSIL